LKDQNDNRARCAPIDAMEKSFNGSMNQLSQSSIRRILPHRYPFLLLDRATEPVPGQRSVGIKNFTGNEDTSLGYSPESPFGCRLLFALLAK
jgi:hypothetical protein